MRIKAAYKAMPYIKIRRRLTIYDAPSLRINGAIDLNPGSGLRKPSLGLFFPPFKPVQSQGQPPGEKENLKQGKEHI